MADVIAFPRKTVIAFPRKTRSVVVHEETQSIILSDDQIRNLVDSLSSNMIVSLEELGLNIHNSVLNIGMLKESVRAILYGMSGRDHPFHELARHLYIEVEPGKLVLRSVAQNLQED